MGIDKKTRRFVGSNSELLVRWRLFSNRTSFEWKAASRCELNEKHKEIGSGGQDRTADLEVMNTGSPFDPIHSNL